MEAILEIIIICLSWDNLIFHKRLIDDRLSLLIILQSNKRLLRRECERRRRSELPIRKTETGPAERSWRRWWCHSHDHLNFCLPIRRSYFASHKEERNMKYEIKWFSSKTDEATSSSSPRGNWCQSSQDDARHTFILQQHQIELPLIDRDEEDDRGRRMRVLKWMMNINKMENLVWDILPSSLLIPENSVIKSWFLSYCRRLCSLYTIALIISMSRWSLVSLWYYLMFCHLE